MFSPNNFNFYNVNYDIKIFVFDNLHVFNYKLLHDITSTIIFEINQIISSMIDSLTGLSPIL